MQISSDFEVVESPSQYWRWARVNAAAQKTGVPRSRLYELIKEGLIRSSVLRHRGKQRGIRLVDLTSLDAYISKHASGPEN